VVEEECEELSLCRGERQNFVAAFDQELGVADRDLAAGPPGRDDAVPESPQRPEAVHCRDRQGWIERH
jgi:hypothetical protein